MKIMMSVVSVLALLWGMPVSAGMVVLTDSQLDVITAGAGADDGISTGASSDTSSSSSLDIASSGSPGDARSEIKSDQKVDAGQDVGGDVKWVMDNGGVDAENVVNASAMDTNTISLENSVNNVILGGNVQKDARSVSISNGVFLKVGVAVNADAVLDRGLGGLDGSASSSGGFLPNVSQSNIIIQQK